MSSLPKSVLDRIRRYAAEGRELRGRYGRNGCMLLAAAIGRVPVVIVRASRAEFPEIRSLALTEWFAAQKPQSHLSA